jgi:hypothetical protein
MKYQRFRWIAVVASLLSVVVAGDLQAQVGMGQPLSYAPQPVAYGVAPAHGVVPATSAGGASFRFASPAMFAGDDSMVMHAPTFVEDGGMCGCDECIGLPTGHQSGHRLGYGLSSLLAWLAPYGEGGCCAPHWFDIHAEAVFMTIDNTSPSIIFSKDGADQNRISSADLGFSEEPGMRITGAYQTGPGSNLEFTYLGLLDHVNTARVESDLDDLDSVFSDFAMPTPLQSFDGAYLHQVRHMSSLNSFELNYRRRWIGPTCTIQGSWLVGVRYAQVRERIRWLSQANLEDPTTGETGQGTGRYHLTAGNNMTGFQMGGDAWICILPGLNVGFDTKAGIYGNNSNQRTTMDSNDSITGFQGLVNEKVSGDQFSFIGEANLMASYKLNHQFTVRGGYQLLFIEGIATAMDNFNERNPTVGPERVPFLANSGNLLYHGFSIGAEWMW